MIADVLYRSNYGRGPLLARVIGATDDKLLMIRWHENLNLEGERGVTFVLPAKFLASPACGWRAAGNAPELDGVHRAIGDRWAAREAIAKAEPVSV